MRVWGLGFGVSSEGFRFSRFEDRVTDFGLRVPVLGLGF